MKKILLSMMTWALVATGAMAYSGSGDGYSCSDDGDDVQVVNVTTPGALASSGLASDQYWGSNASRNKLKITGNLNAADLAALTGGGWATFESVDLTGATFVDGATLSDLESDGKYFAFPSSVTEITAELLSNCENVVSACAVNGADYVGFTNTPNMLYKANQIIGLNNMGNVENITISGYIGVCDIAAGEVRDNLTTLNGCGEYVPAEEDYFTIPEDADSKVAFGWVTTNTQPGVVSINIENATMDDPRGLRQLQNYRQQLETCILPTNLTMIPPECFFEFTKLANITIPDAVTSIGPYAFSESSITSVTIDSSIQHIGTAAFAACVKLYDVQLKEGITSLDFDGYTFAQCTAIKQLRLPEGVINIGAHMFDLCTSLHSVRLPSTLTEIMDGAFRECLALNVLYIPESVQLIGKGAFALSGITDLYLEATSVEKLPKIYSMGSEKTGNEEDVSSFGSNSIEANNTAPAVADYTEKSPHEMEEAYRTALGAGNTLTILHYSDELRSFIDYNPWNRLYPDPVTESGYSGVSFQWTETEFLSDSYLLQDADGRLWPAQTNQNIGNWYYPGYYGPIKRGDGSEDDDYLRCLRAGDPDNAVNDDDPWIGTNGSLLNIDYNPEDGGEPSRVAWRQFVLKMGTKQDYKKSITKEYDDVWYTFSFPYDLTNEQLNTAFNAYFNIVEFNSAEIMQDGEDALDNPKYNLVFHFEQPHAASYTYTDPETGTVYHYQRNVDQENNVSFTPTDGGPDYVKRDDLESYLAEAFHAYMIHPNLGVAAGEKKARCAFLNLIDKEIEDRTCENCATVKQTNEIITNAGTVQGTYTFIGNVDYYDKSAYENHQASKPTFEFNNPQPQFTFSEPEPQLEDYVDGDEPQLEDYAQGDEPVVPTTPEITTAPTAVSDPDEDEKYSETFKNLFTTVRCTYSGWDNSVQANVTTDYTFGDDLINCSSSEFFTTQEWYNNEYGPWYIYNAQSAAHGYAQVDNTAIETYLGAGPLNTLADFNALQQLATDYNNDKTDYENYQTKYAAYLASKAEWDAYRAALERYNNWTQEGADAEYQADHDTWQTGYNEGYYEWSLAHATWVTDKNAAYEEFLAGDFAAWQSEYEAAVTAYNSSLEEWESELSHLRPLIPYNSYFLARPKEKDEDGKLKYPWPKYYREASQDMTRSTGYWTQYSCVIKSDGEVESKLFGIDDVIASSTNGFDFEIGAYNPTTDGIKDVLEDAKRNNLPVQYMDIIYDINGKMLSPKADNDLRNMPKGIYIVNGKKYLVK